MDAHDATQSFVWQEPLFLMGKTMEALLAKSAKLREIQMVLTEEQADQRWGLDWEDCNV